MRQNATTIEPPVWELTQQQDTVLAVLLMGKSVTTAAGEAGIARQTVHRWLASDPDFIAAHNRGRREIADAHAVRLLGLCGQALDVLDTALGGVRRERSGGCARKRNPKKGRVCVTSGW